MTLTKPGSGADRVAAETPADRDRAVDVARLGALVVVMFGHCALLLATIDNGLRIVLSRDPSSPAVAVNLWYGVGRKH